MRSVPPVLLQTGKRPVSCVGELDTVLANVHDVCLEVKSTAEVPRRVHVAEVPDADDLVRWKLSGQGHRQVVRSSTWIVSDETSPAIEH